MIISHDHVDSEPSCFAVGLSVAAKPQCWCQWIGLRENLQENTIFHGKTTIFHWENTICHWKTPYFIGKHHISLENTIFHWKTLYFIGKSPYFMGKHNISLENHHVSWGNTIFHWKTPYFIGKSPYFTGKSPYFMGKSLVSGFDFLKKTSPLLPLRCRGGVARCPPTVDTSRQARTMPGR